MKTIQQGTRLGLLLSVTGLLVACGQGTEFGDEGFTETELNDAALAELGVKLQPVCSNDGGVNGILAALAVASANEMRRWLPTRDFQWNAFTGMLELSKYAFPRCRTSGDLTTIGCPNTQALLDMQRPWANGTVTFEGGIKLDSTRLRQTLKTYWDQQIACNNAGNCPVDYHDLRYHHSEPGPCGTRYFYDSFQMNTTAPLSAEQAGRFANQLLFLGHPSNPFLAYSVQNERASVDPTYGLTEASVTSSGACRAACVMFSDSSVAGACCTCNGATKRLQRSTFSAYLYVCQ